jgi:hypothetical protein
VFGQDAVGRRVAGELIVGDDTCFNGSGLLVGDDIAPSVRHLARQLRAQS